MCSLLPVPVKNGEAAETACRRAEEEAEEEAEKETHSWRKERRGGGSERRFWCPVKRNQRVGTGITKITTPM